MSFTLSPRTLDALRRTHEAPPKPAIQDNDEGRIESVMCWRCKECSEVHECKDDALDCCPPLEASGKHDQDPPILCPVCGADHAEHRLAVDCCLWRDIDAPTRWRIADAVEAGADWAEAIQAASC